MPLLAEETEENAKTDGRADASYGNGNGLYLGDLRVIEVVAIDGYVSGSYVMGHLKKLLGCGFFCGLKSADVGNDRPAVSDRNVCSVTTHHTFAFGDYLEHATIRVGG